MLFGGEGNMKISLFTYVVMMFSPLLAENSLEVFKKYRNIHLVETGSYLGKGIQVALDAGYEQVYSVEVLPELYEYCQNRFQNEEKVHLWLGDSSQLLWDMIQDIREPITFWLDGHYSQGKKLVKKSSPILEELDIIKRHPIKNHVILIDDVRDFGSSYFDYVTKGEIIAKILEINSDYTIVFEDCPAAPGDILVACVRK